MIKSILKCLKSIFYKFSNFSIYFKLSFLFSSLFLVLLILFSLLMLNFLHSPMQSLLINSSYTTCNQISKDMVKNIPIMIEDLVPLNSQINQINNSTNDDNLDYSNFYLKNLYMDITSQKSNYSLVHSIMVLNRNDKNYVFSHNANLLLNPLTTFSTVYPYQSKTYYEWSGVIKASQYFNVSESNDEEIVSFYTNAFGGDFPSTSISVYNFSVKQLSKYLDTFKISPSDQIFIDCGNHTYIKTENCNASLFKDDDFLHTLTQSYKDKQSLDYKSYLITTADVQVNNWHIVLINNRYQLYQTISYIVNTTIILLFIFLITATFLSFMITSTVTKPLDKLTQIMRSVDNEHFDLRFKAKYNDEVGILARAYNTMMDKIQMLNHEVKERENQKRLSDMKLLQMQIQPHFLYNTLETCRFLVAMKNPKAEEMIKSISLFYKLSLNGIADKISIKEELEHLQYYLRIQKIRYPSIIEYKFKTDPVADSFEIPKFTLQPIVENAIYHGLKLKEKKGLVLIQTQCNDKNDVVITIIDNGIGMTPEQLGELRCKILNAKTNTQDGIALINVDRRLKLRFGNQYGLTIESIRGHFTKITVTLPQIKYEVN